MCHRVGEVGGGSVQVLLALFSGHPCRLPEHALVAMVPNASNALNTLVLSSQQELPIPGTSGHSSILCLSARADFMMMFARQPEHHIHKKLEASTAESITLIVTETLAFGVFSLLVVLSTYILIERGLKAKATKAMLTVTVVMYAVAATHWASRLHFSYMFAHLNTKSTHDIERVFYSPLNQCVPTALLVIDILLSDAIVIWRAWILWSHNRCVRFTSALLLLGTLILSAHNAQSVCRTTPFDAGRPERQLSATVSDDVFGAAALALSFFTNLWSTSLVACKVWIHRRAIRAHIQTGNTRTRAEKIMTLLLESGAIYLLIWTFVVVYTFLKVITPGWTPVLTDAGDNFLKGALIQLVGIYPTVVIVFVCLERTHCDRRFVYLPPTPRRPEIASRCMTHPECVQERAMSVESRGNFPIRFSNSSSDKREHEKESDIGLTGTV
ncbi:hypothetical protein OF83DRAFT_829606 [Amylostereum chailletii]|nr:hypothetical protein OF83DRAFT_829606 [Amylostereum chailletii]